MTKYLAVEEILRLHFQIVEDYGGLHGVRDEGRIVSVSSAPKQIIFGEEQYPTLLAKAAVYLRNIVSDYPFVDGNKRAAITACGVFLLRNRVTLTAEPLELENFIIDVVVKHLDVDTITKWLDLHTAANG